MGSSFYNKGDHLVICDSCGAERNRSQCDFTWDGYLMCHVRGCWYPKDMIFETPPVINDPQALTDVRPEEPDGTWTFIDESSGLMSTFGGLIYLHGFSNGRYTFGGLHAKFGYLDSAPDYWS